LALGLAGGAIAQTQPKAAASDLPSVDVPPRPVHAVPSDDPPPRPVTLKGRDGKEVAPRAARVAARTPVPPPEPAAARTITGAARVLDAVTLVIGWRPVTLFGVHAPAAGDRCTQGGEAHLCGDLARDLLALRRFRDGNVACRVPPGQRGGKDAAVCLDANGIDLAGWLVAEGLALADSAGSFDYVGAENVARSVRRGLWRYR
jgi:endonuclease YncB( thermonuclease family)